MYQVKTNIKVLTRKLIKFFRENNADAKALLKGQLDNEKVIFFPEIVSTTHIQKMNTIIEEKQAYKWHVLTFIGN